MNALADELSLLLMLLLLAAMLLDSHTFAYGHIMMQDIGKHSVQQITSEQTLICQ